MAIHSFDFFASRFNRISTVLPLSGGDGLASGQQHGDVGVNCISNGRLTLPVGCKEASRDAKEI